MLDQSVQIQRILSEAIGAARAGDNKYALPLLRRVISMDSQNEQAWLWLSQVEANQADKIRALERVLEINPDNAAAKRGLAWLRQQTPDPPAPPAAAQEAAAEVDASRATSRSAAKVNLSSPLEELKPMLEASRQRKSRVRVSEIVIFAIGIVTIILGAHLVLNVLFPEPERRRQEQMPESRLETLRAISLAPTLLEGSRPAGDAGNYQRRPERAGCGRAGDRFSRRDAPAAWSGHDLACRTAIAGSRLSSSPDQPARPPQPADPLPAADEAHGSGGDAAALL